jgi:orotate phosphoribosyltransferase
MSYLPLTPQRIKESVTAAVKLFRGVKTRYTFIVCSGYSGVLIAPHVVLAVNKELIIVRKSAQNTHGMLVEQHNIRGKDYIILDDFIQTGDTVRRIIEILQKEKPHLKCVGIVAYDYKKWSSAKDVTELIK